MQRIGLCAVLVLAAALGFGSGCGQTLSPTATGFQEVESETIYSVRYDAPAQTLTVVFLGGDLLYYDAVPEDVYRSFLSSRKKDAFFEENIKGKFKSRKATD